jgi:hypothetical protein
VICRYRVSCGRIWMPPRNQYGTFICLDVIEKPGARFRLLRCRKYKIALHATKRERYALYHSASRQLWADAVEKLGWLARWWGLI